MTTKKTTKKSKKAEKPDKPEEEVKVEPSTAQSDPKPGKPGISELTNDYGRNDLNEMRDKINELIRKING